MKTLFRMFLLLMFFGGWGLAASALHMVFVPGQFPANLVLVPKDRMGFTDTFADTRKWTIDDVRSHPAMVARIVHLGRGEKLAHAVPNPRGDVVAQLTDAINHPLVKPDDSTASDRVKAVFNAQVDHAEKAVKSVFD